MSFFDEFNHIVPYWVKVNVGNNKQFKTDESKKSCENHKGKMVAFYKKAETLEELEKHGLGEYMTYLPAEQISMPIDIKITSDEELVTYFEETSKYTNEKNTRHEIRIFNNDNAQVGYVSLKLTPSGDIDEKTCFYESPDRKEIIKHTIYNEMEDEKLVKEENFSFKKNTEEETKNVEIMQKDGKVIGASVTEKELEKREDIQFQSITQLGKDEKTPKLKRYVASCVADETDFQKRGGILIPWECKTLEEDLFKYRETMRKFNRNTEWLKQQTGEEITIQRVIENSELPYKEKRIKGIKYPIYFGDKYYEEDAIYLADSSNDLLIDFKGTYIGNILRLTDKGYEACIVTKHQKDGRDYRLYTLIDLTGTSITRGTNLIDWEYGYGDRDEKYLERLKSCDKTPTFVTTIEKDGQEKIVLYKGQAISGECPEYEEFVRNFITPFKEVKPIQIGKILKKESERTR